MNITDLELIEKWQEDLSFINWANQVSEVDIAKWDAYLHNNPHHQELAELAKISIQHLNIQMKVVEKEKTQAALQALKTKIAEESKKEKTSILSFAFSKGWRVAASFLAIASIALWTYNSYTVGPDEVIWATQEEQKEILLSDGTEIVLNKYSKLSYLEDDVRNVTLDGEAFFNVSKKPIDNEQFSVTTHDLVVQVLGTQFNVKSEGEHTSVYLDEGKVILDLGENENPTLEMEPGDLVSYTKKENKVLEKRKSDAHENIAWKEKVIFFEESSLAEVLQVVSKVYKVNFDTNTQLKSDLKFTGGIPVHDLDIAIETLRDIFKLDIQKIEAKYLIQ